MKTFGRVQFPTKRFRGVPKRFRLFCKRLFVVDWEQLQVTTFLTANTNVCSGRQEFPSTGRFNRLLQILPFPLDPLTCAENGRPVLNGPQTVSMLAVFSKTARIRTSGSQSAPFRLCTASLLSIRLIGFLGQF